MSWSVLLPLMFTSAGTGLTCGLSCGACGNPIVNVFLASYLFTHSGKMKKSMIAFAGFHLGKALTVVLLCTLISILGSQIVDENGNLFGVNLQMLVYVAMLLFMLVLIVQWFLKNRTVPERTEGCSGCNGQCKTTETRDTRFLHMLVYGVISGLSPCASLVVVLGYASALTVMEAILVGVSFSLANSIIPLVLLVALTGVLSKEMFREIPTKIKYFQLVTYILFVIALVYNLIKIL